MSDERETVLVDKADLRTVIGRLWESAWTDYTCEEAIAFRSLLLLAEACGLKSVEEIHDKIRDYEGEESNPTDEEVRGFFDEIHLYEACPMHLHRIWLCSDNYGISRLPSELLLTLLDLDEAPEWYRQQADQWPRKAIIYQDVLGLVIHNFTRRIEDERRR